MKIIINGNFFEKRITGVQRFEREIISELDSFVKSEDNIELVVPDRSKVDLSIKNIRVVEFKSSFSGLKWDYLTFPKYVKKNNGVAVNLANRLTPFTKQIVCLHDITYKVNRTYHRGLKGYLRTIWNCLNYYLITRCSEKLFTVSNFSKSEILKYYPKTKNKDIGILYNAWQHMDRVGIDENLFAKFPFAEKGKYYFSMGSMAYNKNFKWVLSAASKNPSETFVIAGGGKLDQYANDMGYSNLENVHFLGYVSDEEAKTLMKNAKAFLFPTLYEGFGIPPLEAAASGCNNLVISDIEVMREVYGEYATYINPYDYQENNFIYTNSLDLNGLLDKYSWVKSAKALYEFLKV